MVRLGQGDVTNRNEGRAQIAQRCASPLLARARYTLVQPPAGKAALS